MHSLKILSANGDDLIATWDETTRPERLAEIEAEFNSKIKAGYFAADITENNQELVKQFNPNADFLLIPRVQGGRN